MESSLVNHMFSCELYIHSKQNKLALRDLITSARGFISALLLRHFKTNCEKNDV